MVGLKGVLLVWLIGIINMVEGGLLFGFEFVDVFVVVVFIFVVVFYFYVEVL